MLLVHSDMPYNFNNNRIHTQEDEKIALITRKHWVMLLRDILVILAVGSIVFTGFAIFIGGSGEASPILALILSVLLLIIWLALFTAWTNHYLDIWIITDKRIIDIDQISLFKRVKSTIRIERIQNISVKRSGILEEMFNFGTIRVETAGYKTDLSVMEGIPKPDKVSRTVLEYVDIATEHKSRLTHTSLGNPTKSE